MKTLQDVAKSFKKAAGKAIYPGVSYTGYTKTNSSKAFATGNLLSKFVSSPLNQPNQIARKTINGFELVLQIGPQGAEYGTYVHYGTLKMKARPFAEIGANDSSFQSALDEYMIEEAGDFTAEYMGSMDSKWKSAGFSVS